jgi:hypothetical protein
MMAKLNEPYQMIRVESYRPAKTSGLHGKVHIRPCSGQGFSPDMHVECSKRLSMGYPIGSKFKIKAKLTDRKDGGEFLYSYHGWKPELISRGTE